MDSGLLTFIVSMSLLFKTMSTAIVSKCQTPELSINEGLNATLHWTFSEQIGDGTVTVVQYNPENYKQGVRVVSCKFRGSVDPECRTTFLDVSSIKATRTEMIINITYIKPCEAGNYVCSVVGTGNNGICILTVLGRKPVTPPVGLMTDKWSTTPSITQDLDGRPATVDYGYIKWQLMFAMISSVVTFLLSVHVIWHYRRLLNAKQKTHILKKVGRELISCLLIFYLLLMIMYLSRELATLNNKEHSAELSWPIIFSFLFGILCLLYTCAGMVSLWRFLKQRKHQKLQQQQELSARMTESQFAEKEAANNAEDTKEAEESLIPTSEYIIDIKSMKEVSCDETTLMSFSDSGQPQCATASVSDLAALPNVKLRKMVLYPHSLEDSKRLLKRVLDLSAIMDEMKTSLKQNLKSLEARGKPKCTEFSVDKDLIDVLDGKCQQPAQVDLPVLMFKSSEVI